jgi:hypothetical protein
MTATSKKKNPTKLTIVRSSAQSQAVQFLEALRPGGPWWLNTILDNKITGKQVANAAEIDDFVEAHNGKRNIYYTLNPLRGTPKSSKPSKLDIVAVEYVQADLDPRDDESPKGAKARYGEARLVAGTRRVAVVRSERHVSAPDAGVKVGRHGRVSSNRGAVFLAYVMHHASPVTPSIYG